MMMMMMMMRLLEVEAQWQEGGGGGGGGGGVGGLGDWEIHVLEFLDLPLGLWLPTPQARKQTNVSHITLFIQNHI